MNIRSEENDSISRTKRIATLLKGKALNELIEVAESIPLVSDALEVVLKLKERGFVTGIISDSYDCITQFVRNKLGMDFSLSNELEFSRSVCTGEVKLPSFFFSSVQSICRHTLCKTNALLQVLDRYGIVKENAIVVGDGLNDLCMIKESGMGIAFCSSEKLVNQHADVTLNFPSFSPLLKLVT
jgi:glucosyl-3-phosphoglycerate synthase